MTMEKLTKRDYFNRILAYAHEEDKDFLKHEIELLEKKNATRSTKPTKKQTENADLAEKIYNAMKSGVSYRVKDIKVLIPELADETVSINKVSALVTKLKNDVMVSRELVKGVAYFTKI